MRGTAADMQIAENLALAKRRGQRRGIDLLAVVPGAGSYGSPLSASSCCRRGDCEARIRR